VWTTSTGFSFISVWTEVRPSSLTLWGQLLIKSIIRCRRHDVTSMDSSL
jgi:hypothetical protein